MSAVRILLKAAILFLAFNVLYVIVQPLNLLDPVTLYNGVFPGRTRLPYADWPAESHNLSLNRLDAMLASHVVARPKASDEFRVVMVGDSAVWGYLLAPENTQAECLNRENARLPDGRRLVVYNLGYPKLTVVKDLLILRRALAYQPDLIVWPTSLVSLLPNDQLGFAIVRSHYDEVKALIETHGFQFGEWETLEAPTFWDRTFFGQRRDLADWLRNQLYAPVWAGTGVDHVVPRFVPPHPTSLLPDENILAVNPIHLRQAGVIAPEDLALGVMQVGIDEADARGVPVLVINEPIYRSLDHPVRLNTYYPRWAYDSYRQAMQTNADGHGWYYFDLWDAVAPEAFTDTDFHLNATASCAYARRLIDPILDLGSRNP